MNSSFSKKRHISEANSVLESRFVKNRIIESKDAVLNEQAAPPKIYTAAEMAKDPDWGLKFPCIKENIGRIIYKRQGTTPTEYGYKNYEKNEKGSLYSNGRIQINDYLSRTNTMYYWFCKPEDKELHLSSEPPIEMIKLGLAITQQAPTNSSLPGASSSEESSDVKKTLNQTLQWKDCSKKGIYQLGCMDPRPQDQNDIKKIQGCIGVKQDGYFGERTMKTLNKKFPNLGGVARVSDINTICQSQITPVGQSGDNDMDAVPGNQQEPRQVTPVQQIDKAQQNQVRSTQGVAAPRLPQKAIQQAAIAAQKNPTLRPKK